MTLSWQNLAVYVPMLVLLGWAAVSDVRTRRIPNWVSLTVLLSGLAQSVTAFGVTTAIQSLYGFAVGFTVTFVLYIIGGRGAGDVKLTAGIGAWLGPMGVLIALAVAAVVSLVIALAQSAIRGRLLALFRNTGLMLISILNVKRLGASHVMETGQSCGSIDRPMPNAVSMLIATVGTVVWIAGNHAG